MKVIVTNSYDETCAVIANMIKELVNAKPMPSSALPRAVRRCPSTQSSLR